LSERVSYFERVGRKIAEIREKCGIDIEKLSFESGLTISALKLIEAGKRDIKVSELFRISKALNVRISAFLSPCDRALYAKRKEENIENYTSLEKLSVLLGISEKALKSFSRNNEIPHLRIGRGLFFRVSDINLWLEHHLASKKKLKRNERSVIKIYGIEPLLSPNDAGEILGCTHTFVRRLMGTIPYFRIGGRIKFRLSDIVNYRDSRKIEPWEIRTKTGTWSTKYVWPEPSQEEKYLIDISIERKYNERSRPGYVVRECTLESPDIEDLKARTEEFISNTIPNPSNLLARRYYSIEHHRLYGCRLKWWALPEGREGYKVHATGLKSSSTDELRDKVDKFVRTKVSKNDLIDIDYYTSPFSFDDRNHWARITYYLQENNRSKPGADNSEIPL